ncbi:hypothetical protein ABTH30_23685, partial [Acinetobacter baumannii]
MKPIFYVFLLAFFSACNNAQKVNTIVQNGVIYTVDSSFTTVQAMAIKDGIILATGTNEEI